jgi:hypothetical protein
LQDRVGHNFDGSGIKDPASPIDMVYKSRAIKVATNVVTRSFHTEATCPLTLGPNEAGWLIQSRWLIQQAWVDSPAT